MYFLTDYCCFRLEHAPSLLALKDIIKMLSVLYHTFYRLQAPLIYILKYERITSTFLSYVRGYFILLYRSKITKMFKFKKIFHIRNYIWFLLSIGTIFSICKAETWQHLCGYIELGQYIIEYSERELKHFCVEWLCGTNSL